MKWMIASDIHGSAKYCRMVFERFRAEGADRLLLLGDLLYHGPRNDLPDEYAPKEVTKLLNDNKDVIVAVRGNCDAEIDQMVLEFPIMADYAVFPMGESIVFVTHGHLNGEDNPPPLKKGDILLHGHTHVQRCVPHDNFVYMNPGSTSLPKEDSVRGYMLWEDRGFVWKNLETGETIMTYEAV